MKKLLSLIASVAFASSFAGVADAQVQAPSSFATESCRTGCHWYERGGVVYSGAVPKTYRVCAGNASVKVQADRRVIAISSNYCADVNGSQIVLLDDTALAGLLPG
jgi:hypothetical protein